MCAPELWFVMPEVSVGTISWISLNRLGVGCLCLAELVAVSQRSPMMPAQVVLLGAYVTSLTGP